MEHLTCLPLTDWEKFFEFTRMPFEVLDSGNLLMAFGERVFFYERTFHDIFCFIPSIPA